MLLWVCSVITHIRHQNVVKTSVTHGCSSCATSLFVPHFDDSSVIYYWTNTQQHGIYLLNQKQRWHNNLIINNNTIDIKHPLPPRYFYKRTHIHLWCFDSKTLFTLTQFPILRVDSMQYSSSFTYPSPFLCLCASPYVTSPAWRT